MSSNIFCTGLALALALGIGIGHGMMTDRWGVPPDMAEAATKVHNVPLSFGNWQGKEGAPMSDRAQEMSGAVEYISRVYTNRTGEAVTVLLMCGRPGLVSSHAPDVCFTGAGLRQLAKEQATKIDEVESGNVEFYSAVFRAPPTNPAPDLLTYWACSPDGGDWIAISDGRVEFAKYPHLYRTIITTQVHGTTGGSAESPALDDFVSEFLPIVADALTSESAG